MKEISLRDALELVREEAPHVVEACLIPVKTSGRSAHRIGSTCVGEVCSVVVGEVLALEHCACLGVSALMQAGTEGRVLEAWAWCAHVVEEWEKRSPKSAGEALVGLRELQHWLWVLGYEIEVITGVEELSEEEEGRVGGLVARGEEGIAKLTSALEGLTAGTGQALLGRRRDAVERSSLAWTSLEAVRGVGGGVVCLPLAVARDVVASLSEICLETAECRGVEESVVRLAVGLWDPEGTGAMRSLDEAVKAAQGVMA